MALANYPVWTIPPDWANVVTETLSWLTGVATSIKGIEQRQSLRIGPRRMLDFSFTVIGHAARTYFDSLLSTPQQNLFWLPLWFEKARTRDAIVLGDSVIILKGVRAFWYNVTAVFIQGDKIWDYDLAEVTAVSYGVGTTILQLASPGAPRSRRISTAVYPVIPARLNAQPTYNRVTDQNVQGSIQFEGSEAADYEFDTTLSTDTYQGYRVYEFTTNEGDTQDGAYSRIVADIDSMTGKRERLDRGETSFSTFKASDFTYGSGPADDIRGLVYSFRGRLKAGWFVSPTTDMKMGFNMAMGATDMVIERCGFTELGGPRVNRRDIRVKLRDGTKQYYTIASSALDSGGRHEILTFTTAVTSALNVRDIRRISFMSKGRLDADAIELVHQTDSAGVCSVGFPVKIIDDKRTGSAWSPPALLYPGEEACFGAPIRPWVAFFNGNLNDEAGYNGWTTDATAPGVNMAGALPYFVFSAWVNASRTGRGINFQQLLNNPLGGNLTTNGGGDFESGITVGIHRFVPGTDGLPEAGTGGIYVGGWNYASGRVFGVAFRPMLPGKHHLMVSVDSANRVIQCYVDDEAMPYWGFSDPGGVDSPTTGIPDNPTGSDLNFVEIVSTAIYGQGIDFAVDGEEESVCANDLWIARPGSFYDLSVASNRRPFISADKALVILPTNGVANGLTPVIYMTLRAQEVASAFHTNRGSGVDLTPVHAEFLCAKHRVNDGGIDYGDANNGTVAGGGGTGGGGSGGGAGGDGSTGGDGTSGGASGGSGDVSGDGSGGF